MPHGLLVNATVQLNGIGLLQAILVYDSRNKIIQNSQKKLGDTKK